MGGIRWFFPPVLLWSKCSAHAEVARAGIAAAAAPSPAHRVLVRLAGNEVAALTQGMEMAPWFFMKATS